MEDIEEEDEFQEKKVKEVARSNLEWIDHYIDSIPDNPSSNGVLEGEHLIKYYQYLKDRRQK
jgi:hypothetical protein